MNVQEMPPVSASANNTSVAGRPPMLGAQVPGTTGGLPAQAGLSVAKNPMAEQLQSYGRNGDSMLVHMTPGEVGGLQQLAMAMGGSLSINPDTGLPEANLLKKLLPTLLGAGLSLIPGVGPLLAAGIVGGGQTLLTGDINKGLMAGLGAFGGSALAGAAGLGAAGGAASKSLALNAAGTKAGVGAGQIVGAANPAAIASGPLAGTQLAVTGSALPSFASPTLTGAAAKTGLAGFGQRFGVEAARGLGGAAAKYAPYAAGYGLLNAASEASTPTLRMPGEEKSDYKGPYLPQPRKARFQTPEQMRESGGAEFNFFENANPYPGFMPAPGMAEGGLAALPAAGDFQATLDFFNQSPGAITASMYPTGTPAGGAGEKAYKFAQGNAPFVPGTGIPGSGGETLASLFSGFSGNGGGGGASFMDLANMYGGRMSSEIASGPPLLNPLPGTTIPSVDVSGEGIMPDFKLEELRVNPVGMPKINVSSGYGASGSMGGYRGELGGSSPFSNAGGNLNSMGSFGNNLDSRISGGNYTLPTYTPPFTLPPLTLPKDSEDFTEPLARGGEVGMKNGSFVVDARTVSELGNGSSNAGIEHLARMGGRPVRGGGDGVSDSVPARIGGHQKARVARDEVIFSPEAVSRLGSGSHSKGTKKLYALMGKAHSARKKASRGQDTKVAKGLGALA